MSALASNLGAIEEEIQGIESKIVQLELAKLELQHRAADLKKDYNATLPIGQIPPEILVNIFANSLTQVSSENLAHLPGEIESMPVRSRSNDIGVELTRPERNATSDRLLRPAISVMLAMNGGQSRMVSATCGVTSKFSCEPLQV
jgi:hypothetical protein